MFRDVMMLLEMDRLVFKLVNLYAAKLLQDDRPRMVRHFYTQPGPFDADGFYLLTFVKEMLRFQLLSFLKRVQIITKMHNRSREIHATEKAPQSFYRAETFMTNMRWALHTVQHCVNVIQD